MPHRLSKWSFPASLVPPWCPAGCPISPFLPPWCLPGACQAVQMVLSCRRPAGVCPLASGLSKFQWRPACFVPNPGVGPTAGFPYHKTAFKWPLGAPVAQNCLSKASRSTDPSSTAPKFVLARAGHPTRKPYTGLLFFLALGRNGRRILSKF